MARRIINIGSIANDGTGDTLRTAGTKMNANFQEIYSRLGGDSSLSTGPTLTDSGFDFNGTLYYTRVGFNEGNGNIEIDFPDSAGNVLIDSATQTITNKTIDIGLNTINGLPASSFVLSDASGVIDSSTSKSIPTTNIVGDSDTQTLKNKTLSTGTVISAGASITSPKIITAINDTNNNEIIKFDPVSSATNEITVSNSNGGAPKVSVTGSNTNISMSLEPKGSSAILVNKLALPTATTITATETLSDVTKSNYLVNGSGITVTVPNGTVVGEIKTFTNIGASPVVIQPTSFDPENGSHTDIDLTTKQSTMIMWVNSNWYIIGGTGSTS